ncbi:ABC transporter permease, partial [Brachybacterium conglomeratum]
AGGSDGSSSGGAHRADVPVDGGAPPGDAPPTGASGTGTHARQDPSDGTAPASERGEDTTDAQEDHR